MVQADPKITDTIPRASVEQILGALGHLAPLGKSNFEAIRQFLYSRSGRRSPASASALWTVARDVLTELQRLSLAVVGVLPRRRSDIDRLRESPCEITPAGKELASLFVTRRGVAYDNLLVAWLESHPYFRGLLARLAASPLHVPDITSVAQVGTSRSADEISAQVSRNCEDRLAGVGCAPSKLAVFREAVRRRMNDASPQLASPDLDSKKLVDLIQDSVVIPSFLESEQLPFDGVTFQHLLKVAGEFFAAASTTSHPDFSGRIVFSTCDFVPAIAAGTAAKIVSVQHHGGAFARPQFAGALSAAYAHVAASSGGYADAYQVRAIVCVELRIQPPVFAACLKDLMSTGEGGGAVIYTELPFAPPPQGEDYVEVSQRRIGKLMIKASPNGAWHGTQVIPADALRPEAKPFSG